MQKEEIPHLLLCRGVLEFYYRNIGMREATIKTSRLRGTFIRRESRARTTHGDRARRKFENSGEREPQRLLGCGSFDAIIFSCHQQPPRAQAVEADSHIKANHSPSSPITILLALHSLRAVVVLPLRSRHRRARDEDPRKSPRITTTTTTSAAVTTSPDSMLSSRGLSLPTRRLGCGVKHETPPW